MFKRDSKKELIKAFDFRKRYDVFLACAFEPQEIFYSKRDLCETYNFYEQIGEIIKKFKKRPYLPHKEINLNWDSNTISNILNDVIIPNSDIVISYLEIKSESVENILASAKKKRISIYSLIESEDKNKLLSDLELYLRNFYEQESL
ncbi:MAG: hypothetical protein AABW83_03545 [Nanoarchaeota archaeon]